MLHKGKASLFFQFMNFVVVLFVHVPFECAFVCTLYVHLHMLLVFSHMKKL